MKFNYLNPRNIKELVDTLSAEQDYCLIAGGTDLLVKMKEGLLKPPVLVDLKDVQELRGIREMEREIFIGPMTIHSDLEKDPLIRQKAYVLVEAVSSVGSPQIRNMGTVGGNIGNASPAADSVPALMVLEARVELQDKAGREEREIAGFFQGPGKLAIKKGQVISAIRIKPLENDEGAAFIKFGKRKALAISLVNGAAKIKVQDGIIKAAKIALGSVAPTVVRLSELEEWLCGKEPGEETFKQAGELAKEMVKPIDDIRSTAAYRKELVAVAVMRMLSEAVDRIEGVCANE